MQRDTRISRGTFLRVMGAAGVAGSTLSILSGCNISTTPQSSDGGGGSKENKLNLYNWSDYVNPKTTIPNFEKKFGVEVTQDFFADNEALLAKLQAGGTGYDVIVPSDYMVSIMRKSDIIQKLDKSKIQNSDNVGEAFKGLPFDPNNDYSMPYQWGTTGILYNRKELGEMTSWDAMWDPQYKGEIAMMTDVRETMGAALKRLGYSLNTTDSDRLEEAKRLLLEQKPLLRGYFASFEVRPLVQNGDIGLGHVYSGDGFLAIAENKDLDYAIPVEGATRWTDTMAIPVGAPHVDNAHKFINYILSAEAGASLTNYTYYGSPNEAARPMIKEEILNDPRIYPPPEVFDRLEVIEDIGEATREYERIFTEVKSA
ncbi:MAG: spermidine/putrescine ABC transporter substrate-binding protein [Actinomycetota bacterium]|jgi:spermidine/putrescine transport system substrate-binding protein|nr:spermidine/putrescine ABC transporter substrate-binding protein [Actinomycetota bacterium]